MTELKARVAIVTGGGSGVGLAAAKLFAQQGMKVAVVGRRAEPLRAAVEQIEKDGGEALACPADVGNGPAVTAIVRQVADRFGGVDVLINNAGGAEAGRLLEHTDQHIEDTFRAHVLGPFFLARECYKVFRGRGGGHVINVASVAAQWSNAEEISYGTAKAALVKFTQHLRKEFELADKEVAEAEKLPVQPRFFAHALLPGGIKTPFWDRLGVNRAGRQWLEPEQVAELLLAILQHPAEMRPFFEEMFAEGSMHVCSFAAKADRPYLLTVAHRAQTKNYVLA
jgi:NAD(P)-dependent dehydrogenase (short-subunit alcohol dehydrogenase family)